MSMHLCIDIVYTDSYPLFKEMSVYMDEISIHI